MFKKYGKNCVSCEKIVSTSKTQTAQAQCSSNLFADIICRLKTQDNRKIRKIENEHELERGVLFSESQIFRIDRKKRPISCLEFSSKNYILSQTYKIPNIFCTSLQNSKEFRLIFSQVVEQLQKIEQNFPCHVPKRQSN